jgi:hypothetical protein
MAKKTEKIEPIELRPLQYKFMKIRIRGLEPLLVHKLSKKLKQEFDDRDAGKAKKKTRGKVRDKKQEYMESLHYIGKDGFEVDTPKSITSKTRFGFPASGVKKAMVAACRFYDGISMVSANGMFFVPGKYIEIKGRPRLDEFWRRIGTKGPGTGTPDIGIRAKFMDWYADVTIKFYPELISAGSIVNILNTSGTCIGLGEDRPGKSGNTNGTYEVGT